jgi:hypothetical protein
MLVLRINTAHAPSTPIDGFGLSISLRREALELTIIGAVDCLSVTELWYRLYWCSMADGGVNDFLVHVN